jgi:Fic family protein
MHARLLKSGRGSDKRPGEFRRTQNWVGGTRPGNAHFVPPPSDHVQNCMAALERFLHDSDSQYPALIRAALAHVQFEIIHPFLDGNGRIGRLLIAFILHHEGILTRPLLYLSLFFKQHREEYYRLLDRVRLEGDWETWVEFFLEGVEQTANDAVTTARGLVSLFQQDEEKIVHLGRTASTTLRVFGVLCQRPLANLSQISEEAGISYPTASKGIDALIELGIVRELTGQRRNRVFAYSQYLEVLSEGTEPL